MFDQTLVSMGIGTLIGIVVGFLWGREFPSKNNLAIAYFEGRVDKEEGKPIQKIYR